MVSSVLLPEPLGPITATISPSITQAGLVQRVHLRFARPVEPGYLAQLDHGGHFAVVLSSWRAFPRRRGSGHGLLGGFSSGLPLAGAVRPESTAVRLMRASAASSHRTTESTRKSSASMARPAFGRQGRSPA